MNRGFLDTNILIDYLNGRAETLPALSRFSDLRISAVAYTELMAGLHTAEDRRRADEVIAALFEIVHTDLSICREAAALRRRYRIKLPDLIIYATARTGAGRLITRNTKDFDPDWADIYVPY